MSTASKVTLVGSSLGAIGIVLFVHFAQKWEQAVSFFFPGQLTRWLTVNKQAMHQGVVRDMEQQRAKRERQADFEMQRDLEEKYRKVQHVSDGGEGKSNT